MDTHGRLERTWRMESVKSDKGPTAETGSGLVVNDPGPSNGGLGGADLLTCVDSEYVVFATRS